jgi:NTE family protein
MSPNTVQTQDRRPRKARKQPAAAPQALIPNIARSCRTLARRLGVRALAWMNRGPARGAKPRPKARRLSAGKPKQITLALQGGGAHGAFTWGVLDRLLEDGRFAFEGISATSAGAMNAAVLAQGLTAGGNDGAREALAQFWRRISLVALASPIRPTWFDRVFGGYSLDLSPSYAAFDLLTRHLSPYQFNPSNLNPLREVLQGSIDFERLRRDAATKLFIAATNVRNGKVKIFETAELSADVLLASACLPLLFQAVEVDGEHYWDGGYTGNPAIFPLIYHCKSPDVVIVHINPIERDEVPTTAREIIDRANAITFNASLMREMRVIQLVTDMIDRGQVKTGQLRRMLIHSIEAPDVMDGLGVSSKLNPAWDFLAYLRDVGRERAGAWLEANYERIGRDSTVDIRTRFA